MGDIFPFIVGCERSGTTLLRVIFDTHSQLTIPRESHFVVEFAGQRERYERRDSFAVEPLIADLTAHFRFQRWKIPEEKLRAALTDPQPSDYPDAIRRVYALYAALQGKPRYADKTPLYAQDVPLLAALFPESRFVHVIRDGRNVALSLLEVPWGPTTIERAARLWRRRVLAALEAGSRLGPSRYLQYRHEDLTADPGREIRRICDFLELPFEQDLLRYHEVRPPPSPTYLERNPHVRHVAKPPRKDLRSWREQMKPEDLRIFERGAGDLLESLGYERGTDVAVVPARTRPGDRRSWMFRLVPRGSKLGYAARKLRRKLIARR